MPDDILKRLDRMECKFDDSVREFSAHARLVEKHDFESERRQSELVRLTDSIESLQSEVNYLTKKILPELHVTVSELRTRQGILASVFGIIGGAAASLLVRLGISG